VLDVSAPQRLTLQLPHLRMHALAWGPADDRLALCLHGFPDGAWSWRKLGPLLATRGFRVVAPFTRGYAPTDLPSDGDYSIGALIHDAIALHRHLDGGGDAVLIGHDWAAFTANALAAHPDSPFGAHIAMSVPSVAATSAQRHSPVAELQMAARQLRMSWYILFFQLSFLPEGMAHRIIPRLWRDWEPAGADLVEDVANTRAALPSLAYRRAAIAYYRALARPTRPASRYAELNRHRFRLPRVPHPAHAGRGGRCHPRRIQRFPHARTAFRECGGDRRRRWSLPPGGESGDRSRRRSAIRRQLISTGRTISPWQSIPGWLPSTR
jgi:pimeloyl-ACP methyl ester carboxylesterase